METSHRWDTAALRMGAMVSLIFAIPFSIGASWAASRDSTALAIWLVLGAIGGFTLGAGCGLGCSALIFRSAMVSSPQSAPTRQRK